MTDATISGTTAAAANQQVGSGLQSLTNNFQTFLSLLTTQLQNQDPLSPVDSNAFTQQLVQMSGVQQQLLTNSLLTSLVGQGQNGLSGGVNYIGKTVTVAADTTSLASGKADWNYELASNASTAQIEIDDASGNAVFKGPAPDMSSGVHAFSWDGKNSSGKQLADGGFYTLKVTAADASGKAIDSQALIKGQVTGVQMVNGAPYLSVGAATVPLANVIGVETEASN
jgi:flagellar basal-body rod modification protein FlgD